MQSVCLQENYIWKGNYHIPGQGPLLQYSVKGPLHSVPLCSIWIRIVRLRTPGPQSLLQSPQGEGLQSPETSNKVFYIFAILTYQTVEQSGLVFQTWKIMYTEVKKSHEITRTWVQNYFFSFVPVTIYAPIWSLSMDFSWPHYNPTCFDDWTPARPLTVYYKRKNKIILNVT